MHPIHHALYRQDLASFIGRAFAVVNPGSGFTTNWHIEAIAAYLSAIERQEITRLIINMPPRYLKSTAVTVAWPAWLLGQNPATRIMAASYSQELSLKHSQDCRLLIKSPWYHDLFPHVELAAGESEKHKFVTTKRGFRFATSVGGTVTGEGGDILIVDDPHQPMHLYSDRLRQTTLDWFDQVWMSRLNYKKTGAVVVVMQRLHENDLSGHLLAKEGWEHLSLPAIAEKKYIIQIGSYKKVRRKNTLLHASREGKKELAQLRKDLGEYGFAAQYQQQPLPFANGLVKPDWLKRYTLTPSMPLMVIHSWDTAISASTHSDYSVCTHWAVMENGYFLLSVHRGQWEYPELKRYVESLALQQSPHGILIENKASGQQLLQELKRETRLPLIAVQPHSDKQSRFHQVLPLFESGRVVLPLRAEWLLDYEKELFHFPKATHDDQVDSTSQALLWLLAQAKKGPGPGMRVL